MCAGNSQGCDHIEIGTTKWAFSQRFYKVGVQLLKAARPGKSIVRPFTERWGQQGTDT